MRRGLTVRQMMKFVLACAILAAIEAPFFDGASQRSRQQSAYVLLSLLLMLVSSTVLAILLVKRGEFKDRLVLSFLLCTTLAFLSIGTTLFVSSTLPMYLRALSGGSGWDMLPAFLLHLLVLVLLIGANIFLASKLWRKRARTARL